MLIQQTLQIFLSKNPAGFNSSLRTVFEQNPQVLLLILNDRIPDGRDVSWIWDVDFETIPRNLKVIMGGDRAYDLALRLKYALFSRVYNSEYKIKNENLKFRIEKNLTKAISLGLSMLQESETLYILPTYSAMLEVRKILTGRKIL